jgi:L-threonylcarbamoyladenylate synthase
VAREFLDLFIRPLVAPSANRSGRPSPTTYADAMEETGIDAQASLDGGPCTVGLESTVVSVTPGPVRLLRLGAITRAELDSVVGPVEDAEAGEGRSPGRLAAHYAPDAPVRLNAEGPEEGEAFLAFGPMREGERIFNLSPSGDLREAAKNLFAMLRAADRTFPRAIAVATIPETGLGEAINDRLRRAAGLIG